MRIPFLSGALALLLHSSSATRGSDGCVKGMVADGTGERATKCGPAKNTSRRKTEGARPTILRARTVAAVAAISAAAAAVVAVAAAAAAAAKAN